MKRNTFSTFTTIKTMALGAALHLAMVSCLSAGIMLPMEDGSRQSAELKLVAGEKVFYHLASDSLDKPVRVLEMGTLSAADQKAVQNWADTSGGLSALVKVDSSAEPIHTVGPDTSNLGSTKGVVSVGLVVDEKGNVARSFIMKSTDDRLNSASLAAVDKWKFRPAKKDGNSVNVVVVVPIQFKS
ncbi:MAG: TonB family protein [Verrucomicrobiota bacterium JB022]|nr:TonB family protein [Verrucomicrobiota bacterium JB022]